ncbi:MAG: DUF1552 domain-containing protein [Pirellulaceae bacterium]
MSKRPFRLSRRTLLRGAGALVALPYLEAMLPSTALSAASPEIVPRMGMFYFGTGMNMRQFEPDDDGPDFTMSRILKPLEPLRGDFTVLSGTWLEHGGGHDGAYPFSTSIVKGAKQSLSPDQIAARQIGGATRYPSLVLSVDRGTNYGSQALATISWNEQGVPIPAENDPKVLFDRLFRPDTKEEAARRDDDFRRRQSVLDIVRDDARRMERKLGKADREQLDQYFNSVHELEQQLARRIDWADRPKPTPDAKGRGDYSESITPEGSGDFSYDNYAKLMYDLIALAFQTDSTRVVSYVVRKELSGGVYPEFGVSKGYHSLTHHGNDPKNLEELAKVDTIYMGHWAYFLNRLKSIREGEHSLLDAVMLGFSSGMGIGHSKDRLPTVLSGGKALGIAHQGHLRLPERTPISAMWHTMIDRMGVPVQGEFQDSPGTIKQVLA